MGFITISPSTVVPVGCVENGVLPCGLFYVFVGGNFVIPKRCAHPAPWRVLLLKVMCQLMVGGLCSKGALQ